jgi:hypothetical protein
MSQPAHVGVHLGGVHVDLVVVLTVSALAAAVLCGLAVVAYRRRQSRAYLLVVLALAALVARPLIGALSATALLDADLHHLLEHGLDAIVVLLVLGAVYYARSVERRLEDDA